MARLPAPAIMLNPGGLQAMRVEQGQDALAFLVLGPEPVDWKRIALDVMYAHEWAPQPELPGAVKLTDVSFGTSQPNEEAVTLLLREGGDLTGERIEYYRSPGPVAVSAEGSVLFSDTFTWEGGGRLFLPAFLPDRPAP